MRIGEGHIASSTKKKRDLLKLPGSQHKKNDDMDEESRGGAAPGKSADFMEKQYKQENEAKIDALANSVTSIKHLSRNMGRQLDEGKEVNKDLKDSFIEGQEMVGSVVGSMDTMLNDASNSVCCYVMIFTFIMTAILVKFG